MKPWRTGHKIPLNVYEGDRPVCQCHSELDARRIVLAMNRGVPEEVNRSPKPTPGPWHRDQDMPTMILNAPLQQATEIIAQTSGEANARLICAAPELLDACRAGLQNLEGIKPNHVPVNDQIRAAIAKAEGRDA